MSALFKRLARRNPANTQFPASNLRVRHNRIIVDKSQCAAGRFVSLLPRPRRKRGFMDGASRMFPLSPIASHFPRDRRAAVRQSAPVTASPGARSASRMRKGVRAATKNSWRRITTGSNHISAFGVWRDRSRRAMTRINRTGETRWHRLPVPGAAADRCMMP
jgi:hypothetical protein